MSKVRILHLIPSVDPRHGGTIEAVKQLCIGLDLLGSINEVCSADNPRADFVINSMFNLHALGPSIGKFAYCGKLKDWLKLNLKNYDLVIVHGLWQYPGLAFRIANLKHGIPYYIFPHGMLDPWFKINFPLKHLKKWLYWPWFQYPVIRDATRVIFTSEEERILASRSFWLYKANEIVASLGIASQTYEEVASKQIFFDGYPQLKDRKLILFLGRIHPKKGCDLLIRAFAKIATTDMSIHLVMAGPDEVGWAAELKRLAGGLNIGSRITWTGMLMGAEKSGALYASHLFCLPSHQENFGVAIAESLSHGLPVLITTKVNIWREVLEGRVGFVEDDTFEGVLKLLSQGLAMNSREYLEMKASSIQCFANRFNISSSAKYIFQLISGDVCQ